MSEVEKFIDESFDNWDIEDEESVKDIVLSFQKFSDSLVPSTTANVSGIVPRLFALFPPNEIMISRSTEKLFRELYSNAVIAVNKLSLCKSVDAQDCLMKYLPFIGNLYLLHDFMNPSIKTSTELFQIIKECHDTILNVYSYCALINFVGVAKFVNLIMKHDRLFLLYSLLPMLRKTDYPPSLSLAQNIADILKYSYKIVTVAPPSVLETMTKEDAEDEMKEEAKRIKRKLGKKPKDVKWHRPAFGKIIITTMVWGIVLWGLGLLLDVWEEPVFWFVVTVLGSFSGGTFLEWWKTTRRSFQREEAIYAEQLYYGIEGWEVRERGREVRKRKLLQQKN